MSPRFSLLHLYIVKLYTTAFYANFALDFKGGWLLKFYCCASAISCIYYKKAAHAHVPQEANEKYISLFGPCAVRNFPKTVYLNVLLSCCMNSSCSK